MKKGLLIIISVIVLWPLTAFSALTPGDIMIIGFLGDGNGTPLPPSDAPSLNCGDGFAFVALAQIPPGEQIYFTEEEYNANAPAGFVTLDTEGDILWTNGPLPIPAGTVVQITTHGEQEATACGGITASHGSFVFTGFGNWALSSSFEEIYAYQGSLRAPSVWLSVFLTNTVDNVLPGGIQFTLPAADLNADLAVYNGPTNFTDKVEALTSIVDLANWGTENGEGFDCCNATGLEYPGALSADFTFPCDVPSNLTTISLTDNSIALTWDPVLAAHSYEARYRAVGASGWQTSISFITKDTIIGLGSGTDYEWMVRTLCGPGVKSDFSPKQYFTTTGPTACPVPVNLLDAPISDTQQDLDWDPVTEADHFEIRYRVLGGSGWTTTTSATNDISLSPLLPGTTYQWRVRSICAADGSLVSDYSPNQEFTTTGAPACPVPSNLMDASFSDTQQDLDWDPVTEADHFEIRYRVKGSSSGWNTTTSPTNDVSLTPLLAGTTYQWRVRSVCTADGSVVSDYTSSQEFITSGAVACPTPGNLSTTPVNDTSQDLDWDPVTEALGGYRVRYKVTGSSGWTIVNTGTNSLSLTTLSAGTTYNWKVRAICAADGSVVSLETATQTFTTTGATACATPGSLNATGITESSADIDWAAALGAVDYQVQHKILGTSGWTTNTTGGPNLRMLSGLDPSTTYHWRVRSICAVDGSIVSPYSSKPTFTTDAPAALIGARISEDFEATLKQAVKIYSYQDKIFVRFRDLDAAQSIIHIFGIDGRVTKVIDNRQNVQLNLEVTPRMLRTNEVQIVRVITPEGVVNQRVIVSR